MNWGKTTGLLGLIFWLGGMFTLSAQSFLVNHFTTDNGLAHNVGFEIVQDSAGLMWIGTDNGLCSYDGERFQTFTIDDGLNQNPIITIWEDPFGYLMFGPHRTGINYFDGQQILRKKIDYSAIRNIKPVYLDQERMLVKDMHPVSFNSFFGVSNHRNDSILFDYWLLHEKNGQALLSKIERKDSASLRRREIIANIKWLGNPLVANIYQTKDNEIYFMTPMGCYRLVDREKMRLKKAFKRVLAQEAIMVMGEGEAGNIWLAGEEHLYDIINGQLRSKIKIPATFGDVIQMEVGSNGGVFLLSSDRQTLVYWDPSQREFVDLTDLLASKPEISFIKVDRANNLWFTTMGDGVYMLYQQIFQNFQFADPSRSFVNDIAEDPEGQIWLASRNGFSIYQKENQWTYMAPPIKEQPEVSEVIWIEDGRMIIDHDQTKWSYNAKSKEFTKRVSDSFGGLGYLKNGDFVWAVSNEPDGNKESGLGLFRNDWGSEKEDSLWLTISRTKELNFLTPKLLLNEAGPRNTWIALVKGVRHILNDSVLYYGKEDGLPSELVNDLKVGPDGKIWVATEKGVAVSQEDSVNRFLTLDFLQNVPCGDLEFDRQGNLWIGTQQGLYRWDEKILSRFTTQSGMIGNDVNDLHLDRQDRLWIGMSRGVGFLALHGDIQPMPSPELYIRQFAIDGELSSADSLITLNTKQSISWEYIGLNYANPQGVEYRYRLGPDEEWQKTENQSLQLSNLSPGLYQYELQARTERSEWGKAYVLNFEVLTPWWRTVWAIVGASLIIIGIISLFFYLRIRTIKAREKAKSLQSKQVAELELKALEAQINPHFVFNALNAIQCFILENNPESSHLYLTRFARLMRMFLESSRKSQHLLSEEIEMLRLYIEMEQLCYQGRFTYQIELDKNLEGRSITIPAMLLQPFVENAIRHGLLHKTEGLGFLEIHIKQEGDSLYCEIRDNGIGRKKMQAMQNHSNRNHVSRGMQIIEERLQLQSILKEGPITIDINDLHPDQINSPGTRVNIRFPLQTIFEY